MSGDLKDDPASDLNSMVGEISNAQRTQVRGAERGLSLVSQLDEAARRQDTAVKDLSSQADRVKRA